MGPLTTPGRQSKIIPAPGSSALDRRMPARLRQSTVDFRESHGEIVIFLDGDDTLHPAAVENVVAGWEPGISRIQYPLEVIDKTGSRLGLHPFGLEIEDGDVHWRLPVCGFSKFSPMSGNAFARSALEAVLPMDEKGWRICADTYLVMTTPKCGVVKNLYVPLGSYRIHGQNNWYTTVRSPDKAKAIWRNHVLSWAALAQHIEPEFEASTPSLKKKVRGSVELYILKRINHSSKRVAGVLFEGGA